MHLLPAIDPRLLQSALIALKDLQTDLRSPLALAFHKTLVSYIHAQQTSPVQGYISFGQVFKFWLDLSEPEFLTCIDQSNTEFQLLTAYFVCMLLLMMSQGVIENHEGLEWSCSRHVFGTMGWVRNAIDNVPGDLQRHTVFLRTVLDTAMREINHEEISGPLVLQLDMAFNFVKQIKSLESEKMVGARC